MDSLMVDEAHYFKNAMVTTKMTRVAGMLKLPVPEITGGKPTIVKLPPSELQRQMVAALGERAEAVRNRLVAPNEDNMLRITNDGRKLALDQRLMNPLLPDDPDSKANACVERVFTIWERTKAQRSTQMIFCDLSTPRADGFDVYNDIRDKLVARGMDLDIQVARLRTLKAAYNSQHYRLEDAVTGIFLREIRGTECRIQAFEKDMQTAKDSQSYDKDGKLVFSIELDGTTYDKREDAGKALLGLVGAAVRADHPVSVGHYAGFEVTVAYVPLSKVFVAHLVGQATHTTELGSDAAGNMVRLQNVVAALPQEVSGLRNNLQQLRVQLDSAKEELQQPFLQEQELNDKSARLAELDALLNVGNDAPVLEGEAEVVNEDDSVRTPREENELER